jgi:hypothetical protein
MSVLDKVIHGAELQEASQQGAPGHAGAQMKDFLDQKI